MRLSPDFCFPWQQKPALQPVWGKHVSRWPAHGTHGRAGGVCTMRWWVATPPLFKLRPRCSVSQGLLLVAPAVDISLHWEQVARPVVQGQQTKPDEAGVPLGGLDAEFGSELLTLPSTYIEVRAVPGCWAAKTWWPRSWASGWHHSFPASKEGHTCQHVSRIVCAACTIGAGPAHHQPAHLPPFF